MKKSCYILLITIIAFPFHTNSAFGQYEGNENGNNTKVEKQKGILLGDTVYYLGQANCLFIIEKKFLGSMLQATCKALNGKEAFWITFQENQYLPTNDPNRKYYDIVFVGSNARIQYRGTQNSLIKDIAKYNLFINGSFNA